MSSLMATPYAAAAARGASRNRTPMAMMPRPSSADSPSATSLMIMTILLDPDCCA
jgi:hypothetical protein